MEPVTRHVRDIDTTQRRALEQVIGQPLGEDEQVIIQVVTPGKPPTGEPQGGAATQPAALPEWCNVFEGLNPEQVADLEEVILQRTDLTRPSP
jgi:hypothetical protein